MRRVYTGTLKISLIIFFLSAPLSVCECSKGLAADQLPIISVNPSDKKWNRVPTFSTEINSAYGFLSAPVRRIKYPMLIDDVRPEPETADIVFTLTMVSDALMIIVTWILMLICYQKDFKLTRE